MASTDSTPLHPIERRVLESIAGKGAVDFESLVSASGLMPDQVRRSLSWLTSKGLASVSESKSSAISMSGGPPPELVLLERLRESGGRATFTAMKAAFGSDGEFSAAVGRAIAARWVEAKQEGGGQTLVLRDPKGGEALRNLLSRIRPGFQAKDIGPEEQRIVADLLKRGVLAKKESVSVSVEITASGESALLAAEGEGLVEKVTPELLSTIRSSGRQVKLRPIDVSARSPSFYPGRRHPVKEFIAEVREVYLSMGFIEIAGDAVQPAFWNFDALFTPQDHPARELQDTFYLKGERDDTISRTGVVARVASAHEDGWKTGSRGWGYSWDIGEARRLVLRTHNTAVTIQATRESKGRETRVFSVGRVYRNEPLDYKHLAELHQMEGIVIGQGLNLRHLMGVLTRFYSKLGMSGVRLWPSYFPYTEPSMQVMVYYDKVGKWLEMGGSGIFRPEVVEPLGVKAPVLAWGCGLERLLMLKLGIDDIRDLYNNDLAWLRERREMES